MLDCNETHTLSFNVIETEMQQKTTISTPKKEKEVVATSVEKVWLLARTKKYTARAVQLLKQAVFWFRFKQDLA